MAKCWARLINSGLSAPPARMDRISCAAERAAVSSVANDNQRADKRRRGGKKNANAFLRLGRQHGSAAMRLKQTISAPLVALLFLPIGLSAEMPDRDPYTDPFVE